MMQKGRDANPATHKPTAPEEGKNLLLQGTRDHLLSSPVGLEQVPIGMILLLYFHNFDSRGVEGVRKTEITPAHIKGLTLIFIMGMPLLVLMLLVSTKGRKPS